MCEILYIDYGNDDTININNLKMISNNNKLLIWGDACKMHNNYFFTILTYTNL
jgi:hypothetical protein